MNPVKHVKIELDALEEIAAVLTPEEFMTVFQQLMGYLFGGSLSNTMNDMSWLAFRHLRDHSQLCEASEKGVQP